MWGGRRLGAGEIQRNVERRRDGEDEEGTQHGRQLQGGREMVGGDGQVRRSRASLCKVKGNQDGCQLQSSGDIVRGAGREGVEGEQSGEGRE